MPICTLNYLPGDGGQTGKLPDHVEFYSYYSNAGEPSSKRPPTGLVGPTHRIGNLLKADTPNRPKLNFYKATGSAKSDVAKLPRSVEFTIMVQ